MRILLASAEVHPYSKTGGLGDMVGALAKWLAREGHQVGLVTPLYLGIREKFPGIKPFDWKLELPLGGRKISGKIFTLEPVPGLTIYFVDQPEFYLRPGLYSNAGFDYHDNAERFIFLSKTVAHLARYLPWKPEVVHVHDWHVGLVPLLIQHDQSAGWRDAPATALTIHNLAYQGQFPVTKFPLTNLPWSYFKPEGAEFYGQLNCLKAGIYFANAIAAVSPRYAREITMPELGCGLDGLLRKRGDDLVGILNGVDYDEWNPASDKFLPHPYSPENLAGKIANKAELQKELGLPLNEKIPLFGSINRLVEQKGVDIQLAALEQMLGSAEMQFILLGSGMAKYEHGYRELARKFPAKVAVRIGHDEPLSHRIEAGCDFFLLPSRFEPCGLNQMYSLRYGTVPIVRATGGLDDTVIDIIENMHGANGIKFTEFSAAALSKAIRKALALHGEPQLLGHYQRNGMAADFSWKRTAGIYTELYKRIFVRS
jgi:starch synthase